MKPVSFLEQMGREVQNIHEREKRRATIRKHYARFGEKIVNIMMRYASREYGIQYLIKKLKLRVGESGEDERHAAIVNWIYKFGERHFLEMHRREDTQKELSFSIRPVIPQKQTKAPQPETSAPPTSTGTPEKTWPEVDRRHNKDRRQSPERRRSIEVTFKNKRFGGERRGGKDRRKNEQSTP